MKLISFDPGLREAGMACFEDGKLTGCWFLEADTDQRGIRQWMAMVNTAFDRAVTDGVPKQFAFETMSTRKGKEASHGNLFELTLISGLVAGRLLPHTTPVPVPANTWTRGRGKKVNAALMKKAVLDDDELAVLEATLWVTPLANHKEVTDAVGIGLYAAKRWL